MSMLDSVLSVVLDLVSALTFSCRHKRQTRPFTLGGETYKVCLDCARQIFYSPERMVPLTMLEVRRRKAA